MYLFSTQPSNQNKPYYLLSVKLNTKPDEALIS